mgnify:CR=1 FL=1
MKIGIFSHCTVDKIIYENEQYETAASTYEQLENDYSHEYLYLNLGNSYYRMGELGNAVWAYEKAYSIAPRDQDIIYNLNFVRSQVRDRIIPPDNFSKAFFSNIFISTTVSFIPPWLSFCLSIILFAVFKYKTQNSSQCKSPTSGANIEKTSLLLFI